MAALTLTSVTPSDASEAGGTLIEIVGDFADHLGQPFSVYIGSVGDTTDPKGLSGRPGAMYTVYPLNADKLRCYLPDLVSGSKYHVYVRRDDGAFEGTLNFAVQIFPRDYHTAVFSYRKSISPILYAGARNTGVLPPV